MGGPKKEDHDRGGIEAGFEYRGGGPGEGDGWSWEQTSDDGTKDFPGHLTRTLLDGDLDIRGGLTASAIGDKNAAINRSDEEVKSNHPGGA